MPSSNGSGSGRKLFVNLAVRDLERSMDFFAKLGFQFNPKFTDDKAACMVLSADGFVMLLTEPFFKTFTKRQPCDTRCENEALIALYALQALDTALAEGQAPLSLTPAVVSNGATKRRDHTSVPAIVYLENTPATYE